MIDDPLCWRFHGVGLGECGNAEFGDSWCVRSCGCDRDKYYSIVYRDRRADVLAGLSGIPYDIAEPYCRKMRSTNLQRIIPVAITSSRTQLFVLRSGH